VSALTQFTRFTSFPADYYSGDAETGTEPNPGDVATAVPVTVVAGGNRSFTDIVLDDSVKVCGRVASNETAAHPGVSLLASVLAPLVAVLRLRRYRRSAGAR